MSLVLGPQTQLHRDGRTVVLECQLPEGERLCFPLRSWQAVILSLFDGKRSTEEVISIFSAVFGEVFTDSPAMVNYVVGRYRRFLTNRTEDEHSHVPIRYDPTAFFDVEIDEYPLPREAAPVALTWIVTNECDKRCRYCFKNPRYRKSKISHDSTLSQERVLALFDEAVTLGVTKVFLQGGEPFIRKDMVHILCHLARADFDIVILTKHEVSDSDSRTLAHAGLKELHISLDSSQPALVDWLTRTPGSFMMMTRTIKRARNSGIEPILRPTLGSFNIGDFEQLIALASHLGVRKVIYSFYEKSDGRHREDFLFSPEEREKARCQAMVLEQRYGISIREKDEERRTYLESESAKGLDFGCVEGMRGLTFLPDGRVTRCEHSEADELLVGDLKTQSLQEVWNSDRLHILNDPPQELFKGSVCFGCERYSHCNSIRGRCYLSGLKRHGTIFAPDAYCPLLISPQSFVCS